MNKKWLLKSVPAAEEIERLKQELHVDSIVAKLLLQKGITTKPEAESFLRPKMEEIHDPFEMKDMKEAIERINQAISSNEKILLFGDYDVDGTTAVALVYLSLIPYYQSISFYIPDRYTEGYGISKQGIDFAIQEGYSLIIALDCGIKSIDLVDYAKQNSVDFIICDHHQPGPIIPDCIVLDPKRLDCPYPFKELCGCGVGFKVMQALYSTNKWEEGTLFNQLDLVAISIGADIVPVIGENRILAYHGMKKLNENPRVAFQELITLAKKNFPLTLTDVVFIIAPRINAAGRLRSGKYAVELMISTNRTEMNQLAQDIHLDNQNRRILDQEITQEALKIIELDSNSSIKKSTVVYQPHWHKGVVGIVASRLIETHYKPTIVLTKSNGLITGSARSIEDFDLYEAIDACSHLLEQFGGHKHAAGLTLKEENLQKFIELFEEVTQKKLQNKTIYPTQIIDAEIAFNELFLPNENRLKIPRFKKIIDHFEPFGPGNMKPVFVSENVYTKNLRLLNDAHLKLTVVQPNHDLTMEAIGFNMADKELLVADGLPFQLAYTLETNVFREKESLLLNLKDIREI
jgi:single-stranded-DNA-specific exonuclease